MLLNVKNKFVINNTESSGEATCTVLYIKYSNTGRPAGSVMIVITMCVHACVCVCVFSDSNKLEELV